MDSKHINASEFLIIEDERSDANVAFVPGDKATREVA